MSVTPTLEWTPRLWCRTMAGMPASKVDPIPGDRLVTTIVAVWLVAALAVGASGNLSGLRPPVPQLVLAGLTLLLLAGVATVRPLRSWAKAVDPRVLVSLHLTRFIGVYFLLLHRRGELPFEFAVIGGWGDIAVATLAVGLLLGGPIESAGLRRAYQAWNAVGLLDLLFVVTTAARMGSINADLMAPLLRLPLSILPTFLIPLLLTIHVILARRLLRPTG